MLQLILNILFVLGLLWVDRNRVFIIKNHLEIQAIIVTVAWFSFNVLLGLLLLFDVMESSEESVTGFSAPFLWAMIYFLFASVVIVFGGKFIWQRIKKNQTKKEL